MRFWLKISGVVARRLFSEFPNKGLDTWKHRQSAEENPHDKYNYPFNRQRQTAFSAEWSRTLSDDCVWSTYSCLRLCMCRSAMECRTFLTVHGSVVVVCVVRRCQQLPVVCALWLGVHSSRQMTDGSRTLCVRDGFQKYDLAVQCTWNLLKMSQSEHTCCYGVWRVKRLCTERRYTNPLLLLPAGLRVAQPCRYCFTQWSKNGFVALQGRHIAPLNVKFRTPHAKFHVHRGRNVGIQPPKLSKFRILAINLPLGGHSFAQFLQNSQILYASLCGF